MSNLKEEAVALYRAGKYAEAFPKYLTLSEQGDVQSQIIVGQMYEEGLGVQQNLGQARHWYEAAADRNSLEAQHRLGYLFYQANDWTNAFTWYQRAASRDYLPALWRLAWLYKQGKGVAVDQNKAYSLLERAAKSGHIFSKRDLAIMLLKGRQGFLRILKGIGLLGQCILDSIRILSRSSSDERTRI
ncbi:MAG TPA: tetratricopeptide repeat protein [Nitrospiraceae bacterium]|nr:tetratricopeptide repeat protein [Nitrospiraceae bacterium]